ncbi:hypothetical protein GCM10009665_26870 [Kitasatospora nipponensis]|uniref:Peptidase inhibitor family I36 n=1 Tax=Kitasatospora nipponensis TaxID=258049 RepID=A0ABN1W4L9_9ACTN
MAAALGALTLVLAIPGSASAATGDFLYQYKDKLGTVTPGALADPQSGVCLNLPELLSDGEPAFSPSNFTDATATVFAEADCDGDTYYVMNPGKKLGSAPKLRSVIFS